MIKAILAFAFLTALVGAVLQMLWSLTRKEAITLTKILGFSILCALVALLLMFGLVILF